MGKTDPFICIIDESDTRTITINVLVAFVPQSVNIGVLLVIILDPTAIVTSVSEIILVHIPLVNIGYQHTVVLRTYAKLC